MPASFRPIETLLPRAVAAYGGKADALASLARSGFLVPRCYALSGEASRAHYLRVLPEALQPQQLFSQRFLSEQHLAEARQCVLEAPLSTELVMGVARVLRELGVTGAMGVAVRSSNLTAHQDLAAAAGLEETFLQVRGVEAVCAAIVRSWSNLFHPRILAYLQRLGGSTAYATGILVQVMLPAEISGVLFTENPLTGDANELVIDATYGLGTVLVAGSVTPDTYRVDRESGWVRDRVVGQKTFREDAAPLGGLCRTEVEPARVNRFCLLEHQLGRLVELAGRLERHFGAACEMHWAIVEDKLYVVRARSSGPSGSRRVPRGRVRKVHASDVDAVELVWSNSHVGELLPGVATPLTWSVVNQFCDAGFESLFRALGCDMSKHETLIGNFRGRPYMNLTLVAQFTAQMPGLGPHSLLPLASAREFGRYGKSHEDGIHLGMWLRAPLIASRLSAQHLSLGQRVHRFELAFADERRRVSALDLRILPGAGLDATLSDVHRLLHEAGALLATVYGALVLSQVPLQGLLQASFGDDAQGLRWDFLAGLADPAERSQAERVLLRVAAVAAEDMPAREALLSADPPRQIEDLPEGPTRFSLQQLLGQFGHGALRQLELSQPRFREQPFPLLDALRAQLLTGDFTRDPFERGRARLSQAEQRLERLSFSQRNTLRGLLSVNRHYLRLRERVHQVMAHVLDMFRWVVLDAARRLQVREPECGPEATFFLHLWELHALLRGELTTVAPLVHRRRAQYARDMALPPPPHTFVGYPRPVEAEGREPVGHLRGLGASSGVAEGRVCVLRHPADGASYRPGDVLVVPVIDAGLFSLLTTASALVAEIGCPLSQGSGVARELGLPTVVQAPDATQVLKTGDRARVDGANGMVARL